MKHSGARPLGAWSLQHEGAGGRGATVRRQRHPGSDMTAVESDVLPGFGRYLTIWCYQLCGIELHSVPRRPYRDVLCRSEPGACALLRQAPLEVAGPDDARLWLPACPAVRWKRVGPAGCVLLPTTASWECDQHEASQHEASSAAVPGSSAAKSHRTGSRSGAPGSEVAKVGEERPDRRLRVGRSYRNVISCARLLGWLSLEVVRPMLLLAARR